MRRAILFVFSLALTLGGAWLLFVEATNRVIVPRMLILAAVFMVVIGGYVLWDDFISPSFDRSRKRS